MVLLLICDLHDLGEGWVGHVEEGKEGHVNYRRNQK